MKTITTPNYNNKLNNDVFLHIDIAPAGPIKESALPIKVMVKEMVSSNLNMLEQLSGAAKPAIEFEAEVIDFQRLKIWEIGSVATWVSNACSREDFIDEYTSKRDIESDLAIYIIKKVK